MMRFLSRLFFDRRAALAPVMALVLPVLTTAVGVSVDLGRAYLVHDRLGRALDAAALAAGSSSGNADFIEDRFHRFFQANYPDGALGDPFDLSIVQEDMVIAVSAKANVQTTFMRITGIEYITVESRAVVRKDLRGLEIALVLDVTGSMWSTSGGRTNIRALKDASRDFINIIYDRVDEEDQIRIAIVPYAAMVNPGSVAPSIVDNPYVVNWLGTAYAPYDPSDNTAWWGCVYERPYPHDVYDTSVAAGGYWTPFRWLDTASTGNPWDNNWRHDNGSLNLNMPSGPLDSVGSSRNSNYWRHPNMGCPSPIIPLQTGRANMLAHIDALTAWNRGGTLGNVGMAWGVRVLSPEEPFTEGRAFDDDDARKVIVMMTDGDNTIYCQGDRWSSGCNDQRSDETAYRRVSANVLGTTSRNTALSIANARMAETCEYAKSLGITVYTITFATSLNATTRALYEDCATDANKYYNAPTQSDLEDAFRQISRELSNLHLAE